MKFAVVLFLACFGAALAEPWTKNIETMVSAQGHRLYKRQSGDCNADITETSTAKFLKCSRELSLVFGVATPGQDVPDSELEDFCAEHCDTYVIDISKRIAVDCGIPDAKPDAATESFVKASCLHGPNNKLCSVADKSLQNPPDEYFQCIGELEPNPSTCPNSCKTAEDWITTNLGCCYSALVDYYKAQGLDGSSLDKSVYWSVCGKQSPQKCPNCTL